jgi:hypothetical protein
MKQNFFGVYLTDVIAEMCRVVDVKMEDVDFTEDGWYLQHSWKRKDQDKFVEWFARFLKNMGPRRELCKYPSLVRTQPERIKFAEKFVNEFGWKIQADGGE